MVLAQKRESQRGSKRQKRREKVHERERERIIIIVRGRNDRKLKKNKNGNMRAVSRSLTRSVQRQMRGGEDGMMEGSFSRFSSQDAADKSERTGSALHRYSLSVCASCLTLCVEEDSECVYVTVCHLFHSMNIDERFCMQLQLLQDDVHIVCKEMKKSTENRLKTSLGLDQRCSSLPSPMVAVANKNNVHIPIPNFFQSIIRN